MPPHGGNWIFALAVVAIVLIVLLVVGVIH